MKFKLWVEQREKKANTKVVSYDFDNTLTNCRYTQLKNVNKKNGIPENKKMLRKIKKDIKNGNTVFITTARESDDIEDIAIFLKKHKLKIDGIITTNRNGKGKLLKHIKADIHYDDVSKAEMDKENIWKGKWILCSD